MALVFMVSALLTVSRQYCPLILWQTLIVCPRADHDRMETVDRMSGLTLPLLFHSHRESLQCFLL